MLRRRSFDGRHPQILPWPIALQLRMTVITVSFDRVGNTRLIKISPSEANAAAAPALRRRGTCSGKNPAPAGPMRKPVRKVFRDRQRKSFASNTMAQKHKMRKKSEFSTVEYPELKVRQRLKPDLHPMSVARSVGRWTRILSLFQGWPTAPICDFMLRISGFVRRTGFSRLTNCAGRALSRRGEALGLPLLPAAQCEVSPEPIEFSSTIKPKAYVKFARPAT